MQQHPRQAQHHIQLLRVVHRQSLHGGLQISRGDSGSKVVQELRDTFPEIAGGDCIEPATEQTD